MLSSKRQAMYNDETAPQMDLLVEKYAPLVKRIAHHLMGRMPANILVDDLYQSGMLGLMDAIKRYESGKGASFETYASIRIRGAMVDEVRKGEWAPRSVHRNARRIQEAIREVEHRTGADANDRDIAEVLGISLEEYYHMLQDSMATRLFSLTELDSAEDILDTNLQQDQAKTPLEDLQNGAFRTHLARAIEQLSEREQLVISLYYEEELNLKEIGEVLGVSESRVSQIHSQAAQRLRARLSDWL